MMTPDPASLKIRLISGFILGPLALLLIYNGGLPFLAMMGVLTFAGVYEWLKLARHIKPAVFSVPAGLIYIAFGFYCAFLLREHLGLAAAFLFIGMIWFSDIGAYFSGKTIGGPKLAVHISPNKTWAGFFGAFIAPGLFGMLWLYATTVYHHAVIPDVFVFAQYFILGAIIGVTGQVGDLLISWFKRRASVKDTGTIIPGHGGILDRTDSILLGAPVFFYLATFFTFNHG